MHIGVLTTSWPHDRDPIAGCFVRALTDALIEDGHACTVLFAAMPSRAQPLPSRATLVPVRYAPGERSLFYQGGSSHHARARPIESALLAGAFTAQLAHRARAALDRCDALVSHFALPSALIAATIARGRAHHAIVHGSDALLLSQLPRALHRVIARGASSVQFAHPGLRAGLDPALAAHDRSFDAPMAAPAPSPAAIALRARTRAALGLSDRDTLVLSVARIAHEKGLDVLARASRSLDAHTRVVIAGDGPERDRVRALAREDLRFIGAVDSDARDRLLAAADVFALPSRRDGAPAALVEALSYGLPIVATDVGGVRWLAGDAARYVGVEDPAALAHTIKSLANSQDERAHLSAIARERHRALPTWKTLAARVAQSLMSVGATQ